MAKEVSSQIRKLESKCDISQILCNKYDDILTLIEMYRESLNSDLIVEIEQEILAFQELIEKTRIRLLLSGPYDESHAIFSIHAGAGGTESCDFSAMLFRMYCKWADQNKYRLSLLDFLPGDEAGYKHLTFVVEGSFAYGYLKAESGVHRIKRISPYGDGAKRHTSFVSVSVCPQLAESSEFIIDEKDLKIETFCAGGPGGQNVNKTASAVRMTYLPLKIVAQSQNERSQLQNKKNALMVLRARVLEYKLKEEKQYKESFHDKKNISFGQQIRTYSLAPGCLVTDHRTGWKSGDTNKVLNGNIMPIIESWLTKFNQD